MHYNPFEYIHSEKDILKLVTALMANTKGIGKAEDPFWEKSELLLYTVLIGYIHYVCPMEEQNFTTLLDMLNSMDVREDDEDYLNPVDIQFEALNGWEYVDREKGYFQYGYPPFDHLRTKQGDRYAHC